MCSSDLGAAIRPAARLPSLRRRLPPSPGRGQLVAAGHQGGGLQHPAHRVSARSRGLCSCQYTLWTGAQVKTFINIIGSKHRNQEKYFRFYGNLCCHFTVPNTSDVTRVSFDMRVLSLDHHDPDWTDRLGRKCLFKVRQYYKVPGDR